MTQWQCRNQPSKVWHNTGFVLCHLHIPASSHIHLFLHCFPCSPVIICSFFFSSFSDPTFGKQNFEQVLTVDLCGTAGKGGIQYLKGACTKNKEKRGPEVEAHKQDFF